MSPERDALDREIDAVLASMAKEEPRRVNGASVRRALDASRPVRWPLWLAVAAGVVVGLAITLENRRLVEVAVAPAQVALSSPSPEASRPEPSPESVVRVSRAPAPPAVRPKTSRSPVFPEPDGGLPRLLIASLEQPEPLVAGLIQADAIVIAPIDIAPLSVPTLSTESEPNQEKPQP